MRLKLVIPALAVLATTLAAPAYAQYERVYGPGYSGPGYDYYGYTPGYAYWRPRHRYRKDSANH